MTIAATSLRSGSRVTGSLRLNVVKDPTPHHNDANPYDVDGDGFLTPLDPLIIINYINNNGVGPIEEPGEGESALPDLDVDGDGEVSPLDILILINRLNQQNVEDSRTVGDVNPDHRVAEGEGTVPLGSSPMSSVQAPPANATIPSVLVSSAPVSSAQSSSSSQNDASLASYLSDLSDEVGKRKQRRR